MREMKIVGLYPRKRIKTTIADLSHQKFAYLLKELIISFPNQVWATDITYIALPSGFVYLVAIIDIYSRYILDHKIAVSLDAEFCCKCLSDALKKEHHPQIFNSDQGSQFTSTDFVKILQNNQIQISMDGKADASTISLLRGFGEQLSKKMFTTSATKQWLKPRSVWVSLFCGIIMRGCIRALITERRIRFIAVCRFVILRRFFLNFLFLRKATLRFVIQGAHCRPLTR